MALFGAKKVNKENKSVVAKSTTKSVAVKKEKTNMQDLYNAPSTAPKVSTDKAGKVAAKNTRINQAYKILIKPVITEKATHLNAINKYVFMVASQANRIMVAQAVEAVYGVKPTQVNLINVIGKKVIRGRIKGERSDWRKAIVTLKSGESIKIYEGV